MVEYLGLTPSPKTTIRRLSGLQSPPRGQATPSSPYNRGARAGASSSGSTVDEAGGDEREGLDMLAPELSGVPTTPRSDIRNLSAMSPEHLSFGDQDGEEDEEEDDEYIEHERAKRPTDRQTHLSPSPWATSPAPAFPITPLPPTAASPISFSPVVSSSQTETETSPAFARLLEETAKDFNKKSQQNLQLLAALQEKKERDQQCLAESTAKLRALLQEQEAKKEELVQLEAALAREEHEVRSVNADIIELREKVTQLQAAKQAALKEAQSSGSISQPFAAQAVVYSAGPPPVRLYAFGALFALSLSIAFVAYVWLALTAFEARSTRPWARPS